MFCTGYRIARVPKSGGPEEVLAAESKACTTNREYHIGTTDRAVLWLAQPNGCAGPPEWIDPVCRFSC